MKILLAFVFAVATLCGQVPVPQVPPGGPPAPVGTDPVPTTEPVVEPETEPGSEPVPTEIKTVEAPRPAEAPKPAEGVTTRPFAVVGEDYAYVMSDRVRVRGAPTDAHVVLEELARGSVVKVMSREGDWCQVEVPGGLVAFVSAGESGRPYVSEETPGNGIVLVDDLMIRGDATKNYPSVGRLMRGDRVGILERRGEWLRIFAPPTVKGYMHVKHINPATDVPAAASAYAALQNDRRNNIVNAGIAAAALAKRDEMQAAMRKEADAAFALFEMEQKKPLKLRDSAAAQAAVTRILDASAAGTLERSRAESLLKTMAEWETAKVELGRAAEKLAAAKTEVESAETTYKSELEIIRTTKRAAEERGREPAGKPAYITTGVINRSYPLGTGSNEASPFALFQGSGSRKFIVESTRYNLQDYAGKLVGVIAASEPEERPGRALRVMRIDKLEIIDQE